VGLFPKNTLDGHAALGMLLALDLFANGTRSVPSPEGVSALTFYVMGALYLWEPAAPGNYWTSLPEWPVYVPTPFYLGTPGALLPSPQAGADSASFVYDPLHSVPTYGGSNFYLSCGPLDQHVLEARPDVLVFTSAPLAAPLAVTGPLRVDLWVSSNATDTDFTAKVCAGSWG